MTPRQQLSLTPSSLALSRSRSICHLLCLKNQDANRAKPEHENQSLAAFPPSHSLSSRPKRLVRSQTSARATTKSIEPKQTAPYTHTFYKPTSTNGTEFQPRQQQLATKQRGLVSRYRRVDEKSMVIFSSLGTCCRHMTPESSNSRRDAFMLVVSWYCQFFVLFG